MRIAKVVWIACVVLLATFLFVVCLQKRICDLCLLKDVAHAPRPGDILCREMGYWWARPFGYHAGLLSADGKHVYHLQRAVWQKEAVFIVEPLEEFVKGHDAIRVLHIPQRHRRDLRDSFREAEEWVKAGVATGGPFGGRAHILCGEPNCETYALMLVQKPEHFRQSIQIWRIKQIARQFYRVLCGRKSVGDLLDGDGYHYTRHVVHDGGLLPS